MASLQHHVLQLHERLYIATGGRIGHRTLGVPSLLLSSTGRRTGQTRTNALAYARDGERYLVVASNGGAHKAPAWVHNVRAQPEVEIQVGRDRRPATAEEIGPGAPDYDRLWKVVNDNNRDRFAAYQKKTSRPIPIVALTPA